MNIKATFIAAMVLFAIAADCHAQEKAIKSRSFSFADGNSEFVLEIDVRDGRPETASNIGTKIIEVRKDSALIARMETIRLEDYDVGEGLQSITQEGNLLSARRRMPSFLQQAG